MRPLYFTPSSDIIIVRSIFIESISSASTSTIKTTNNNKMPKKIYRSIAVKKKKGRKNKQVSNKQSNEQTSTERASSQASKKKQALNTEAPTTKTTRALEEQASNKEE